MTRAARTRDTAATTGIRRLTTARLLARHVRTGVGGSAVVAALVLLLTIVAVIVPPAATALLDAGTRYQLDRLTPAVRDLATTFGGSPPIGPGPAVSDTLPREYTETWGAWDSALGQIMRLAPTSIQESFTSAETYLRLGRPGPYVTSTSVVLDPRYASRIEIVEGRLPTHTVTRDEWDEVFAALINPLTYVPLADPTGELPATEIVLSAAAADRLDWAIGESRSMGREAQWMLPVPLTLVGTFDVVDPTDPFWARATGMIVPFVGTNPDGVEYVRTVAFAAPEAFETLPSVAGAGQATEAWYPLDPETVTSAEASALVADLRAFTTTAQRVPGLDFRSLTFQTGAIEALDRAVAQARTLVAVLAMFAAGPFGVAVAVLALGCRLIIERRRAALDLLAARGASGAQLRRLMAVDGLLVGILPAALGVAVGVLVARLAFPDVAPLTPIALVAAAVLALVPLVVVVAAANATRRGRTDASVRGSRGRAVAELVVVLLAALATMLLVLRGAEGTPDAGAIDPLFIAAPVLLALVACIVTLRLSPLVLRAVLAARQRGSGFVGVLGAARAIRDPTTGVAPVLALVVGVAFAVASGILLSTVQAGAGDVARAAAGADLQLTTARFADGDAEAIAEVDGVAAIAPISVVRGAKLLTDNRMQRVLLYLADRDALDEAQVGYPHAVPPDVDLGSGSGPVPLLFSPTAAQRAEAASATLKIEASAAEYAGTAAGIVPFATNDTWVLADISFLDAVGDVSSVTQMILVRLEDGADAASVLSDVQDLLGPGVEGTTAEQVLASLENDPSITGLRTALLAGVALSAVLAAVAVVVTLVLGGRSRRRVLALLRTLGAPPRAGAGLVAWELVPAVLAALVVGSVAGTGLAVLLARVVELRAFTAGVDEPALVADPVVLAVTLGGFLAATALVSLIAVAVTRRARIATILRTVEDT